MLLTHGSRHGGYALYVADGRLHYVHDHLGLDLFTVSSDLPLPTGELMVRMDLEITGSPDFSLGHGSPAEVRLFVGDEQIGFGPLPQTCPTCSASWA